MPVDIAGFMRNKKVVAGYVKHLTDYIDKEYEEKYKEKMDHKKLK